MARAAKKAAGKWTDQLDELEVRETLEDADEMLRRGYDVHLHYANFGIRKLKSALRKHGLIAKR